MDKIYSLLETHRLQSYYNKFLNFGVKDERDLIDGVNGEDLNTMGFSHIEKNRFASLQEYVRRLRSPQNNPKLGTPVQKSMEAFHLKYTYPHCPEPNYIRDMDPAQNTLEDLMLRICYQECVGNTKGVCLYTVDGMPLTDDPFFNTWSLTERHIENGSVLYAIFTPKENLKQAPKMPKHEMVDGRFGGDTLRCHIMLKGDYEVKVDLKCDTIKDLRLKLAGETGIPAHVLHYRGESGSVGDTLQNCGVTVESTVHFSLTSFPEESQDSMSFCTNDITPSVQQTPKGLSVFFSTLYAIKMHQHSGEFFRKLIAYIRKLSGCNPLAQSLFQFLYRNEIGTRAQKIAIVEGLYNLFRELLPSPEKQRDGHVVEDFEVFESANVCWATLLSGAETCTPEHENYAPMCLTSQQGQRFSDPVRVPGIPDVLERAYVLQKIKDGEKIPNCTDKNLRETSMKRATDVEKLLLSLPPSMKSFPVWISFEHATSHGFQISDVENFGNMMENVKKYSYLTITPPLMLKETGLQAPMLVLLNEANLGVYVSNDKSGPQNARIFNCMAGKIQTVDLNLLANEMRDTRSDQMFITSRTPKEAILVLIDTSTSMTEQCYEGVTMKRIDAVKELFHAFATRTMAYNLHHVIGLMTFGSLVQMVHAFTETLETFMEYVRSVKTEGCTRLYDALQNAITELDKVKKQFPDCKLRIICLTDGNDVGSGTDPRGLVTNLMSSGIVVDAVLVGDVLNDVLHGISYATGGYCFKPMTCKDGLKLFEMETVLSMELRKPKEETDPSVLTSVRAIKALVASKDYDESPENVLPLELGNKVTVAKNALKKNSKTRCHLEKDRRILAELRSLHCDPHPFCTIYPTESDMTFWKILMQGPPDTSYENGVFELYCQFGDDYPVKPPLMRFVTPVYHCNVNSVGRICHNIFDRNYSAHITMREILDAVYGLLILPEPEDPLDSILAEEFMTSRETYEQEAKKNTEEEAGTSLNDMEQKLVGSEVTEDFVPPHLICILTKKMFVDPVMTIYGTVYERKAIEKHLKTESTDPVKKEPLHETQLKPYPDMRKMVRDFRSQQIQ
ncbi:uncharacterized protein LOC134008805 [Osmerus eperlanus]|uniref:uncharacterized protein LOC134008805 n=1 Tax=Osmerus eperlanus TaxID=29151 RepID=UPI002E0DFA50